MMSEMMPGQHQVGSSDLAVRVIMTSFALADGSICTPHEVAEPLLTGLATTSLEANLSGLTAFSESSSTAENELSISWEPQPHP